MKMLMTRKDALTVLFSIFDFRYHENAKVPR